MLGSPCCGALAAGVTLLDPSCGDEDEDAIGVGDNDGEEDDDGAAEDMVRVGKRTKWKLVSTSRS